METIHLFDLDNTLTYPCEQISHEMSKILKKLSKKYILGIVSSSNYERIQNQIGDSLSFFKYIFCENGTVTYEHGRLVHSVKFSDFVGEENFKKLINFILNYLSTLDIPIKRGNFINCRNGLISVTPIGRDCTVQERLSFIEYEEIHKTREKFIQHLKDTFSDFNIDCTIGGKISFEIFPLGWDKTYCLKFLENYKIIFYGDKTHILGNDYSIYKKIGGHSVLNPEDTLNIIKSYIS